jgi:hypothetical protein
MCKVYSKPEQRTLKSGKSDLKIVTSLDDILTKSEVANCPLVIVVCTVDRATLYFDTTVTNPEISAS